MLLSTCWHSRHLVRRLCWRERSRPRRKQEVLAATHDVRVRPIWHPDRHLVLVVMQLDCTERKQQEARLTRVADACVQLLEAIFPRHVIEHLCAVREATESEQAAAQGTAEAGSPARAPDAPHANAAHAMLDQLATKHQSVTLFFCDIVGFTTMSKEVEPVRVMRFLNELYTAYDALADEHGVFKVETVGDCYVVAGGLMSHDDEGFVVVNTESKGDVASHAAAMFAFAKAVLQVAARTPMPHNGHPTQIRIGIHSGPVTSGIVGYRMPKFCLFGDSMNTASQMESTAKPGTIHLSQATYDLLALAGLHADLVCTGGVHVKGKGHMVTYTYVPQSSLSHSMATLVHDGPAVLN